MKTKFVVFSRLVLRDQGTSPLHTTQHSTEDPEPSPVASKPPQSHYKAMQETATHQSPKSHPSTPLQKFCFPGTFLSSKSIRTKPPISSSNKNLSLANLFKPRVLKDFVLNESSKSLKRSRSTTARKAQITLNTSKQSCKNLLIRNRCESRPKRRLKII